MPRLCEIEGISAVLAGSFNPSIFQPAWLAKQGLIRDEEAESATIDIIRPEISVFSIGADRERADFRLLVEQERFQAESPKPEFSLQLRDLVLGIFQVLEHTPLRALGINRHMHFRMPSEEVWHTVGHRLAPKDLWSKHLTDPGLAAMTIRGRRPDGPGGAFAIRVEPSTKVLPGVYFGCNEEYAQEVDLLGMLASEWENAQRYSRRLSEGVLDDCLGDHE